MRWKNNSKLVALAYLTILREGGSEGRHEEGGIMGR